MKSMKICHIIFCVLFFETMMLFGENPDETDKRYEKYKNMFKKELFHQKLVKYPADRWDGLTQEQKKKYIRRGDLQAFPVCWSFQPFTSSGYILAVLRKDDCVFMLVDANVQATGQKFSKENSLIKYPDEIFPLDLLTQKQKLADKFQQSSGTIYCLVVGRCTSIRLQEFYNANMLFILQERQLTNRSISEPITERHEKKASEGGNNYILTLPGNVSLELVKIKAGSFTMGSPASEKNRENDETQHRVTLKQDYWLGKYEVTQGQWKAVMENNPSSFKKGDNYPVECVSWDDAMEFCKKLTENERAAGRLPSGYAYTLPTEAQWEYAARGGRKANAYYVYGGGDDLDSVGWYGDNSDRTTQPVGQKRANELGLYDMSGNVSEWCRDWYGDYPSGDITNPVGPANGSNRVNRGGSWRSKTRHCRSADRSSAGPAFRNNGVGFRVALAPVQ